MDGVGDLFSESTGTLAPYGGDPVPVHWDGQGKFEVEVSPLETSRMRQVAGARHLRKRGLWVCPDTRAQAAALSGVFRGRLAPTAEAQERAQRLFQGAAVLEQIRGEKGDELATDTGEHLFDFQRTGVRFLRHTGSALLGDEMGTGKTIQAIEWMRAYDNLNYHLVVCPKTLIYNWARELAKWWPEAFVVPVVGSAAKRRKLIVEEQPEYPAPLVFIINYEGARLHSALKSWGGATVSDAQKEMKELNEFQYATVVADEAHRLKNPSAKQTMAVKQLGTQAEQRLAMTGTPVKKNPDDLWSIMEFVAPREYGSRGQFRTRYCNMVQGWHQGFDNMGLKESTRAEFDSFFLPRFLRRTKLQVFPDMPEKMPLDVRHIPMESGQSRIYNALVKDMFADLGTEMLIATSELALRTRLRQAAQACLAVEDGRVVGMERPSNKLSAVMEIKEELGEDPLPVYGASKLWLRMAGDYLVSKGFRVGHINGDIGARVRESTVQAFQDGELDYLLCQIQAAGEGITLTRASTIVLMQSDPDNALVQQAIDRLHRHGQDRTVTPIMLLSEGTVDMGLRELQLDKHGQLQALVRDPKNFKRFAKGESIA